jgi:SAM-dependent methyltransferase
MTDRWFELASIDHFWIEWRFEAFRKHLALLPSPPARVLEIGCGHGVFRQQLEEQIGYTVDGCDLGVPALRMAKRGRGHLMVYDIHDRHPSVVRSYPAVFLMDVVEHIDDDAAFLESAAAHCQPGGVIGINVPAGQWLYSRYDEEAGHVRRYTKATMRSLLKRVGLTPLALTYWGFSLVPLLVARKAMLSQAGPGSVIKRGFQPPGAMVHRLLKTLMKAEIGLLDSPPTGTSLLASRACPLRGRTSASSASSVFSVSSVFFTARGSAGRCRCPTRLRRG